MLLVVKKIVKTLSPAVKKDKNFASGGKKWSKYGSCGKI
jgi:hypothetical protein